MYKLNNVAIKLTLLSVNNLRNLQKFSFTKNCIQNTKQRGIINNFHGVKQFSSMTLDRKRENDDLIPTNSKINSITKFPNTSVVVTNPAEPQDYRTIFIENLPKEWTEDEIKVRLEQIGPVSKIHIIKDSIGIKSGKVLAVFQKVDHVIQAINSFKDKMPRDMPVRIRFFRESLKTRKTFGHNDTSSVLIVKNIPDDLRKEDLNLFISQFKQPVHISYPRDHQDEFKKIAFIYFLSNDDAEHVLKYANLRYVKNKQLYFQFSFNYYDITDFRTRAELGIKLEPVQELKMYEKQIAEYKLNLQIGNNKRNKLLIAQDDAKLEYLTMRKRKFEFALGITAVNRETILEVEGAGNNFKEKRLESANTKKFMKKLENKVDYNEDKSIVFYNSHKYITK